MLRTLSVVKIGNVAHFVCSGKSNVVHFVCGIGNVAHFVCIRMGNVVTLSVVELAMLRTLPVVESAKVANFVGRGMG